MPDTRTAEERRLAAQHAIHVRWSRTGDRSAATAPARAALNDRFVDEVDPDRVLPPDERAARADSARRAYFARLSYRAAKARRLAREAKQAEAELRRAQRAEQVGGAA